MGLVPFGGKMPVILPSEASDTAYRAVSDGDWNDPNTWEDGEVPPDSAEPVITSGTTVTLRGSTNRMYWVHVKGTLKFDTTTDTHLKADTLKSYEGSTVHIGTPNNPVQQDSEARITFLDTGPIDEEKDPSRKSRGFMTHGEFKVSGVEKTAWTELASHPRQGDTTIELPSSPTNWEQGDDIVIPGMTHDENQDEERTVAAVNDTTVELDSALDHDHVPPKSDLDSYVLNLSRNVILESENTDELRRGHGMVMGHGSDVRWARFVDMGRTNKDQFLTNPVRNEDELPDGLDPNPAARYPMHYHRTGIDGEKHIAKGLSIDGGLGWGFVNHHANAEVTDCITYRVLGSGFVAEGGNERGSFKRNFALRSQGSGENLDSRAAGKAGGSPGIDDFGHAGHGFWFQSPLVKAENNVAAGHRHFAFVFWTRPLLDPGHHNEAECHTVEDSRVNFCPNTLMSLIDQERHAPMLEAVEQGRFGNKDKLWRDSDKVNSTFLLVEQFKGNTAFASAGGLDFSRNSFKWIHQRFSDFSVIDDFTVYNVGPFVDDDGNAHGPDLPRHRSNKGGNVGVSLRYASNVTIKNSRLLGSSRKDSVGIIGHDYVWTTVTENSEIEGWDWGIWTGEHRLDWIRNNTFSNNNYDVSWILDNTGPAILEGNDLNSIYYKFGYNNIKGSEVLTTTQTRGIRIDGRTAYLKRSDPDFVPFPDQDALDGVNNIESTVDTVDNEEDLIGLTNREMFDQFGICIGGTLMPDDAVDTTLFEGKLEPKDPSNPPTSVFLDSVNADQLGMFEVVSEDDVAGGQCLRCTGSSSPKDNPASISFDAAAGTYKIFFRFRPDAWNGDAIQYRIDGGDWYTAEKMKTPIGFEWHAASPNNEPAHEHELSEGSHTLEFACGNDDVKLDEIFIASDSAVVGAYGESQ